MGVAVSRDQLQAGDLVFFNGLGHAGIYIGGDQFIHSPHTGDVVKISSLSDSWYASHLRRTPGGSDQCMWCACTTAWPLPRAIIALLTG